MVLSQSRELPVVPFVMHDCILFNIIVNKHMNSLKQALICCFHEFLEKSRVPSNVLSVFEIWNSKFRKDVRTSPWRLGLFDK